MGMPGIPHLHAIGGRRRGAGACSRLDVEQAGVGLDRRGRGRRLRRVRHAGRLFLGVQAARHAHWPAPGFSAPTPRDRFRLPRIPVGNRATNDFETPQDWNRSRESSGTAAIRRQEQSSPSSVCGAPAAGAGVGEEGGRQKGEQQGREGASSETSTVTHGSAPPGRPRSRSAGPCAVRSAIHRELFMIKSEHSRLSSGVRGSAGAGCEAVRL